MGETVEIDWHGESLQLLAERAVHWPRKMTLFIADPHFGKSAAFRSVGIPVPDDSCRENCRRLTRLLEGTGSERLVVLGDFLHSSWGRSEALKQTLVEWRRAHEHLQIDLVRGNHDLQAGDPWSELAVDCRPEPWRLPPWSCRHEPDPDPNPTAAALAGHVHPALRVAGKRAPCFWLSKTQLVLPAFGEFTGSHLIQPALGDRVFVTDDREIIGVPVDLG